MVLPDVLGDGSSKSRLGQGSIVQSLIALLVAAALLENETALRESVEMTAYMMRAQNGVAAVILS